MDITPNLSLPYILAAQAQKHVTHNEALRALDAIVHPSILDRDLTAPPGSPADGARYIVAGSPTGAWAGQAGRIAAWQDGAWVFYTPKEGWVVWIADEDKFFAYNGTTFVDVVSGSLQNVPMVGINTTADTTNRLAVSSPASLFNHAGAGHQVKVNKNAAGDTASFLFQTGFSGRAEIGTIGSDDFQFKVSADGSAWRVGLAIVSASGQVGIGTASPDRLVHAELDDAVTNAVSYVGRLTHTSSGTVANGFGVGLEAELENASGTNKVVGTLEWVFTDATSGSEDADLVVKTMLNGAAAAERLRLTSAGRLGIGVTPTNTTFQIVSTDQSVLNVASNHTVSAVFSVANTATGGKNWEFAVAGPASGYGAGSFVMWNATDGVGPLVINQSNRVKIGFDPAYDATAASMLTVFGNAAVGEGYKGNAAPANGLIVEGNVGIGKTNPSTKLDVEGPVRVKSYTVAGAPSASGAGAGAIIYVSDETGGAALAFSDGTNWRRVTDRAVIT